MLVLAAAASFGLMPAFAAWPQRDGVQPQMLMFVRFGIAAAIMVAIVLVQRRRWPQARYVPALLAMGALYVLESLFYFHGLRVLQERGVNATGLIVLLLYTCPAMVAILSRVLLKERLTRAKMVALSLALAGVVLAAGPITGVATNAVILGLSCAMSYAVYIVLSSRISPHVGAMESATVVILVTAVMYGVLALVRGEAFPATPAAWAGATALATVSTVFAITAFLAGMQRTGPTTAATLSTIEPAVAVVAGRLLLGDHMTLLQMAGGAIIILAAMIAARAPSPAVMVKPDHL